MIEKKPTAFVPKTGPVKQQLENDRPNKNKY